eukprot:NODE_70_length_23697_cov_0.294771.p1 type:complete len:2154 gc:universal NODE_70_length_23697_cov_0.294771:122-6583(+)
MIEDLKTNFIELLELASKCISLKTQFIIDSVNIDWERKEPEFEKLYRAAFVLAHYESQYCYDIIQNWLNDIENQEQYKMIVENRIGKDGTSMKDCYLLLSLSLCARVLSSIFDGVSDDVKRGKFGYSIENALFVLLNRFSSAKQKLPLTQYFFKNILKLLNGLLDIRFIGVTDRLLSQMKSNSVNIEKYCKFIRHLSLTYYPTDKLEESADFLKSLSEMFFSVSEHPLKKTLSDTIVKLLLPAIHTLKAELKIPTWASFVDDVLTKILKSLSKTKYASYNFQLAVHILCASPEEKFLLHWSTLIEIGIKYKDSTMRNQALYYSNRLIYTYVSKYCNNSASLKPVLGLFSSIFPFGKRGSIIPEYSEILMVRLFFPMFIKYPTICFKNIVLIWLQHDLIMNNNGKIDMFCHDRFYLGIVITCYYAYFITEYDSLSDFRCDVPYEELMNSKNISLLKLAKIEDMLQVLHIVIFRYLNVSSLLFLENSLFGEKFLPTKFIDLPIVSANVEDKLNTVISNFQTNVDRVVADTHKLIIEYEKILLPLFDVNLRAKTFVHGIMSVNKNVSIISYQTLKSTTATDTIKVALEYLIKKLPQLSNPLRLLMNDGIGYSERYGLVSITCDLFRTASARLQLTEYLPCLCMVEAYCCLLLCSTDTSLASCSTVFLESISKVSNELGLDGRLCHLFDSNDLHSFSFNKSWKKMFKSDKKEENWRDVCFKVVQQYSKSSNSNLFLFREEIFHAAEVLINEVNMSVENATLIWAPRISLDQKIYEDLDCYLIFLFATSTPDALQNKQLKKFASLLRYIMTINSTPCRYIVVEIIKRFKSSISELLIDEFQDEISKVTMELGAKSFRKTKKYTKLEPRTVEWLIILTFLIINCSQLTTTTSRMICEELLTALFDYVKTDHLDNYYYNLKIYFNLLARHVHGISSIPFVDAIGSKLLVEIIEEVKNWTGYYKVPVLLTRHDTAVSKLTETLRDFNEKEKVAYMFEQSLFELQEESISLILVIACREFKTTSNDNDVATYLSYINFIECVLDDLNIVADRNVRTTASLKAMINLNPSLTDDLIKRCFNNTITSGKSIFYSFAVIDSRELYASTLLLALINLISFPLENRTAALQLLKQSYAGDSLMTIIMNIKQQQDGMTILIICEIFECIKHCNSTWYSSLFKILILFIDVECNDVITKHLINLTYLRYNDCYISVIETWKAWFNTHLKSKCESLLLVLTRYNITLRQIKFIEFTQIILKIVYTECCKEVYLNVLLNSFTWEHLIFQKSEEFESREDEDVLRYFQEEPFKGSLSISFISFLNVSTVHLLSENSIIIEQYLYLFVYGLLHFNNTSTLLKPKIHSVMQVVALRLNVPFKRFNDPTDYFLEIVPHLTEELKVKLVDQIVQWLSYCPIVKFHIPSLKFIQILNPKVESYIFLELINLLQKTLQDTLDETIALKEQVYETIYYLLHEKQFTKTDKSYALFLTNIIKYCPEDDANFSTFTRVSKMFLQLYPKTWFLIEQETDDADLIQLLSAFTNRYFKRHLSSIDYFTFIDEFIGIVYQNRKNNVYLAFVFIGLLKLREEFHTELQTSCVVATLLEMQQVNKYFTVFSTKKLKDYSEFLNQTSNILLLINDDAFHSEFSSLLFEIFEYSKDPLETIQFIKRYTSKRMREGLKIFLPNFDAWLIELKFEESVLSHMMTLYTDIMAYEQKEAFVGNPLHKFNSILIYNDSLKTFLMKWKPDFQMKNTLRFSYDALLHDSIEESMRSSISHFDDHLATRLDFIPSASSLAIYDTNNSDISTSSSSISLGTSTQAFDVTNLRILEENEDLQKKTEELESIDELTKMEPPEKLMYDPSKNKSQKHKRSQSLAAQSSKSSTINKDSILGSAIQVNASKDHSAEDIIMTPDDPMQNVEFEDLKRVKTDTASERSVVGTEIEVTPSDGLIVADIRNSANKIDMTKETIQVSDAKDEQSRCDVSINLRVDKDGPDSNPSVDISSTVSLTPSTAQSNRVSSFNSLISEEELVFPLKKRSSKKRSKLVLEMNSVCTEGYLQKNIEQYKSSISSTLKIELNDIESFELTPTFSSENSTRIRVELNADEDADLKLMETEISSSIRNGSLLIPVISNQISLGVKDSKAIDQRKSDSTKSDNIKRKANLSRPSVKNLFQ